MLNVKPDKPLSESLLSLIRVLDDVARALDITYFIIGATARDILMEHVHGLETVRATRDIDFAVGVASWEEYERLKISLTASGKFTASPHAHRLIFGEGPGAYPLDLVPFDGVERGGQVAWPPDGDFVMNVAGYADAYKSALDVAIEPGLPVKIVSLPAMVVLKILAWSDRPERDKDASDVFFILRTYHEAGQAERLYDEGIDLLERYGYEIELAGSALLGRDARRDIALEARTQVMHVLANERKLDKFIAHMARAQSGDIDQASRLIKAFVDNLG